MLLLAGDAFNPDCIRFSYATSDDILKKLKRIKEALALNFLIKLVYANLSTMPK
jgi:hypothetical protein